jgi:putative membrane protein
MTLTKKRILELGLFTLGLALFYLSLKSVGFERLSVAAPAVMGAGIFFLAIYFLICGLDTLGWKLVFSREESHKVGFVRLFWIRVAGQAVNNITPFIDIGGEFLKINLLYKVLGVDRRVAVASVILSRTLLLFSEVSFWFSGILIIFYSASGPDLSRRQLFAIFATAIAVCTGLLALQKKGFFLSFVRSFERIGFKPQFFEKYRVSLEEADRQITSFYSAKDGRFYAAFFLHYLSWLVGGLETWVLFQIMRIDVPLVQCVMIEGILQLVRTLSFFIPGNLGAQEGGLALVAQSIGLHPSAGVALSLLKRFRQIVWTAIGFAVWGYFQWAGEKDTEIKAC